jgi:lysophospholipase L1-like esterase
VGLFTRNAQWRESAGISDAAQTSPTWSHQLLRRSVGPFTVVTLTVLACAWIGEIALRHLAPVPDPYEENKTAKQVNQFIKSPFPRNIRIQVGAEKGLPGVDRQSVYSTNNMGFRGDEMSLPKPPHEFRVFMIGGSTTECLMIDDSKSIDRVLQNELNKDHRANFVVKVYNAGRSGEALPDHISVLVHRIVHLRPDALVLFSGINDLTRSIYKYDYSHYIKESSEKYSLRFLLQLAATEFQIPRRIQYLITRFVPKPPEKLMEEITVVESNYGAKARFRKSTPVSNLKPRVDPDAYRVNLNTIVGVARAQGIKLVFMTQQSTWKSSDPTVKDWQWMQYRNGVTYRNEVMDEALESLNDVMRDIAAKHSVPLYDAARQIPKSSEFFYDDVHFNVKGARQAGLDLASLMKKSGLIPDNTSAPQIGSAIHGQTASPSTTPALSRSTS